MKKTCISCTHAARRKEIWCGSFPLKAIFVILFVVTFHAFKLEAATIYLKDGKSVTGEITLETDTKIKMKERVGDTGYGEMEYLKSAIARVDQDFEKMLPEIDPSVDSVISYDDAIKNLVPEPIPAVKFRRWEFSKIGLAEGESADKRLKLTISCGLDTNNITAAGLIFRTGCETYECVRNVYESESSMLKQFIQNVFPEWRNGFGMVDLTVQKIIDDAEHSKTAFGQGSSEKVRMEIGSKSLSILYGKGNLRISMSQSESSIEQNISKKDFPGNSGYQNVSGRNKSLPGTSKITDSHFYYVADHQLESDSDYVGMVGISHLVVKVPNSHFCQKILELIPMEDLISGDLISEDLISSDCYPSNGEYEKYFKLEPNSNWYLADQTNEHFPQVVIFEWNTIGESFYADFHSKFKLVRKVLESIIAVRDGSAVDVHIISPQGEVDIFTGEVIPREMEYLKSSIEKIASEFDPSVDGVISYDEAIKDIVPVYIQKMSHDASQPLNVNSYYGEANDKVSDLHIKSYDENKIEYATLDIWAPLGSTGLVRYLYHQRELLVYKFIRNMFPEWRDGFKYAQATVQKMFDDAAAPDFDPIKSRLMVYKRVGKKELRIEYTPTHEVNMEVTQSE